MVTMDQRRSMLTQAPSRAHPHTLHSKEANKVLPRTSHVFNKRKQYPVAEVLPGGGTPYGNRRGTGRRTAGTQTHAAAAGAQAETPTRPRPGDQAGTPAGRPTKAPAPPHYVRNFASTSCTTRAQNAASWLGDPAKDLHPNLH